MSCDIVSYFLLYLAAAFGAAFGFGLCAILTITRDEQPRDEHEEFPGC